MPESEKWKWSRSVQLVSTPWIAAHQALLSLVFSRQEYWSGLLFPSPMRESEVTQSCLTLPDPKDCSLPGSSIHGIFQARTLEWVAISFSNARKWKVKVKSLSPTLQDPMDYSPPGSPIHGIFQARVQKWIAIAFSDYLSRGATIRKFPLSFLPITEYLNFCCLSNNFLSWSNLF